MMAMLSESRSASSMKCVVSSIARPFLYLASTAHRALLEAGSTPDVGSSATKENAGLVFITLSSGATSSMLLVLAAGRLCSVLEVAQAGKADTAGLKQVMIMGMHGLEVQSHA